MSEQHRFELEVRVSAASQPDAILHREYTSKDSASTDKALTEVWAAVNNDTKARMSPVADDQ